jgi:hypothetical protein
VNELVETAFALEEDVGVRLTPIVVNGLQGGEFRTIPSSPGTTLDLAGAEGLSLSVQGAVVIDDLTEAWARRADRQLRQRRRLAELLPLPQVTVPFLTAAPDEAQLSIEAARWLAREPGFP